MDMDNKYLFLKDLKVLIEESEDSIDDIAIYLVANDGAIPFYQKLGMKKSNEVMEYNHVDWTPFKVE